MKIALPWWHRALRPWFDFLAARRARKALKKFERVGYFLVTSKLTGNVVGIIAAYKDGRNKRKVVYLEGRESWFPTGIVKAWVAGDDSVAGHLHPTPFKQDQQQVLR